MFNKSSQSDLVLDDSFWASYYDTCIHINNKKNTINSLTFKVLNKFLQRNNLPKVSLAQAQALINSPFTQGDLIRTYHLIRYYQLSEEGLFITNENVDKKGSDIQYIGADNWEKVMCYLDSLLFAMFANLDSFEPILFISNHFDDPLVNRLSILLRVYVNLLRSGNTIKIDLTIKICETLAKLGFTEAISHKQQDSATLFEFLTEKLSMPLLTFKIDIQHSGKFNEEDDQKYSKERLLFVSIPETDLDDDKSLGNEDDNDVILLEECLEHYFNSSISVMRQLKRRATLDAKNIEDTIEEDSELSKIAFDPGKDSTRVEVRTRSSTLSIWSINDNDTTSKPKEVCLPAWMFLRLLPFYTDDNNVSISQSGNVKSTANNSKEFANRRPVLPICLKRYSFENKRASRLHRKIIIPPIINLPQFVADDDDDTKSSGHYKLILESAICHRGVSISSGHFVAGVRKNYYKVNESETEAFNAPWHLYNDLHNPKVVEVSFQQLFDQEWPYMLFYRLISIEQAASSATSVHSGDRSSLGSSKVIIPQGSKSKYWNEDLTDKMLSPIISHASSIHDNSLTKSNSNRSHSSIKSTPIPDISPLDSKFVDIKLRYYWYIPDEDKNYYKEYSNNVSHRRSSLTAQYRRNSQWSAQSDTVSNSLSIHELNNKLQTLSNKIDKPIETELDAFSLTSNKVIGTTTLNLNPSNDKKPHKPDETHEKNQPKHAHLRKSDHKKAKKKKEKYNEKCRIS